MQLILAGHDHNNDFGGDYYNKKEKGGKIHLAYGRKTGMNKALYFNKTHGGRIIKYILDATSGEI